MTGTVRSARGMRVPLHVLLLSILLAGFFLRAYQFSLNPPGLYFDEASAGYESFSLSHTGADRWGTPLPIYFEDWGSGRTVLYSYLSIPFVWLFGLSRFSVRLLSLFLGTLTFPLLYVTVKRRLGKRAALLATALLAFLPWHIMVSRWALDANIAPFFFLLGIYTLTRALEPDAPTLYIFLALVPWGLALYAYMVSAYVLPVLLAFIVLFQWKLLLKRWRAWLVSAAIFAFTAFPIALFLVKNFIVHNTLPFEGFLPFGIPLLMTSRLQSVTSPIPGRWIDTFFFVLSGFQEGDYHDSIIGHAMLFMVSLPLCLAGATCWLRKYRRSKEMELCLLWLLASLPLLFLMDPNVHRFNLIILPVLVASACGLLELGNHLEAAPDARRILLTGVTTLVSLQAALFMVDYYLILPNVPEYQSAYAANYDRAIAKGLAMAPPSDPILLQPSLEFSYIFALFYTSYPPERFQREVKYSQEYSEYWVRSFGRFYVGVENLPDPEGEFAYILGKWVEDPCPDPTRFWETRMWKVGQCHLKTHSAVNR